jgi:hypothetical protein
MEDSTLEGAGGSQRLGWGFEGRGALAILAARQRIDAIGNRGLCRLVLYLGVGRRWRLFNRRDGFGN